MLPGAGNRLSLGVCFGAQAFDPDVLDCRIRTLEETPLVPRIGVTRDPDGQFLAAPPAIGGTDRCPPDCRGVRQQVFAEQPHRRVAPAVGALWVESRTPTPDVLSDSGGAGGVITTEVKKSGTFWRVFVARLGDDGAVGPVKLPKGLISRRPTSGSRRRNRRRRGCRGGSESLHRISDVCRQWIVDRDSGFARLVDEGRPGMRQHDLRMGVERVDAALQQVWGVEVVVGHPLEEFSTGLFHHEIVVERRAAVDRLMDVPYAVIFGRVLPGDVAGAIGGAFRPK